MKNLLMILMLVTGLAGYGQEKMNSIYFNKLTEIRKTEYVIASMENWYKTSGPKNRFLLFIDTKSGQTAQVDFPDGSNINELKQIVIDSLDINVVLVSAHTLDLNLKGGIDWRDPEQIFIISKDGKQKNLLTDDKFNASTWTVNNLTGTIVITGRYDSNNNRAFDIDDKSEIYIYDLKSLKRINKI